MKPERAMSFRWGSAYRGLASSGPVSLLDLSIQNWNLSAAWPLVKYSQCPG